MPTFCFNCRATCTKSVAIIDNEDWPYCSCPYFNFFKFCILYNMVKYYSQYKTFPANVETTSSVHLGPILFNSCGNTTIYVQHREHSCVTMQNAGDIRAFCTESWSP